MTLPKASVPQEQHGQAGQAPRASHVCFVSMVGQVPALPTCFLCTWQRAGKVPWSEQARTPGALSLGSLSRPGDFSTGHLNGKGSAGLGRAEAQAGRDECPR